jgi:histidinol-phosphate aminotransferase
MFEKLVSANIASLVPYPPGKPLEELERELGITGAVKIASNENPLGPSPKAVEAIMTALSGLHRYPDGSGYYLKQALAGRLGLDLSNIILGNGSNEIIELAVRTFLQPDLEAVFSDPTFLVYAKVVQGAGAKAVTIPLRNFKHDLTGLAQAVTERTRLLFLDNPNNPSGTLVPAGELKSFIADLPAQTILVLDEAYLEFVRNQALLDPLEIIPGHKPVIFLRTFSKIYGLAGLRIGYGLAHKEIIDYLDRVRQPFNVNTLAQRAALAALDDTAFFDRTRELVWTGLEWLWDQLDIMGVGYLRTQTNFFLIQLERSADEISKKLLHEGVIVRSMSSYGLPNFIRINVGLPEENQRFITTLRNILKD